MARLAGRWLRGRAPELLRRRNGRDPSPGLETAYCAKIVAIPYEEMGLLAEQRSPIWYDPGRFRSGDDLTSHPVSGSAGRSGGRCRPAAIAPAKA